MKPSIENYATHSRENGRLFRVHHLRGSQKHFVHVWSDTQGWLELMLRTELKDIPRTPEEVAKFHIEEVLSYAVKLFQDAPTGGIRV